MGATIYGVDIPSDSMAVICGSGALTGYSANYGASWTTFYIGIVPLTDICFPNAKTGFTCGGTIAKTTNGGLNWHTFCDPVNEQYGIHFPDSLTGYSVGGSQSFSTHKTTNGGISRMLTGSFNDTIPLRSVYFINKNTGWVCGGYGTIRKTTNGGTVSVKKLSVDFPNSFSLSQNYPNPFNAITKIKFDIPKTGFVTVKVFDALGRDITMLINEQLTPGTYQPEWNAENYPSGVYYYRLTTDGFIEKKKMILLK